MIAVPFNDLRCLGSVTEVIANLVAEGDPVIVELAAKHPTTESLASWIRGLPQRDDDGGDDGPRVDACDPPQRLRIPAPDPNCVERASLYVAVAELIDHAPVRQLATLDTPIGLHTFPLENGAPVILDPRVPHECLDCGVALAKEPPVAVEARAAVEWTTRLAEAGAATLRNGPNRVRHGRNALMRLVDQGAAPADADELEAIACLLGVAERVARTYGPRALAIVRSTAHAVADLADEVLARAMRNVALELDGMRIEPPPWMAGLSRIAARVGFDVGAIALRGKLLSLGIGDEMLGMVEQELNREGLSMGPLARPSRRPTFATVKH